MNSDNLKASPILYTSSSVILFIGMMLPLLDITQRANIEGKTFTQLFEWNIFSEWGIILIILSLLHFWLAVKIDGRGQ